MMFFRTDYDMTEEEQEELREKYGIEAVNYLPSIDGDTTLPAGLFGALPRLIFVEDFYDDDVVAYRPVSSGMTILEVEHMPDGSYRVTPSDQNNRAEWDKWLPSEGESATDE